MSQYWMIFEPLFILILIAIIVTLAIAAFHAIRGRGREALHILEVLALGLASYFAICCLFVILTPRRVLAIHQPQCFDDWCIELDSFTELHAGSVNRYQAGIRVFSRAERVAMRENGILPYLEDDRGRRYAALTDPSDAPTNVLLQAGESVTITRGFELPANAHIAGFVVVHEGFPIGWFVIGEGQGLFHKETITHIE
jgi:hypothetical protein